VTIILASALDRVSPFKDKCPTKVSNLLKLESFSSGKKLVYLKKNIL
jgi:hypothetical protein